MRIISGILKGRKLISPKAGDKTIRPTSDFFREMMFNILCHGKFAGILQNAVFADICSGTGAVAFEAISRGAKTAIILDIDSNALNLIKKNIDYLGIKSSAQTIQADATKLPEAKFYPDIIFIDPPYESNLIPQILQELHRKKWLKENMVVIVELDSNMEIEIPNFLKLETERFHGISKMMIFTIEL